MTTRANEIRERWWKARQLCERALIDVVVSEESIALLVAAPADIAYLLARVEELEKALKPFANFACDPPCEGPCHNCIARTALETPDED